MKIAIEYHKETDTEIELDREIYGKNREVFMCKDILRKGKPDIAFVIHSAGDSHEDIIAGAMFCMAVMSNSWLRDTRKILQELQRSNKDNSISGNVLNRKTRRTMTNIPVTV